VSAPAQQLNEVLADDVEVEMVGLSHQLPLITSGATMQALVA
jgi:hypothetical protein